MPANHKLCAMLIFLPKVSVAMNHEIHTGGHGQEEGEESWGKHLMLCLTTEKAECIQNLRKSRKVETPRAQGPLFFLHYLLSKHPVIFIPSIP